MSVTIYTPLLVPLLDSDSNPVRIPKFAYTGQAMSERKITATIASPTTLALVSGCYITFRSETFRLYETPAAKKTATSATSQSAFEYTLVFYSAQHELATTDFIDIVSDTSHTYFNGGPIVDFVGTIPMLVERLRANLDRIYTGLNAWEIVIASGVDLLESAQISLTDSTVWDALMLVNTTANWGYKFHIRGHVITIGESGTIRDEVTFEYGRGKGLYEISRTNVDSSKLITRLRAYGGTQNIPADYKKDGAGYVAPTYQYVKELSIPAYCYVSGATVNAVGKGLWASTTQYAIGDLVRYDKKRFYARAIPTLGYAPPIMTTEWSATTVYFYGDIVTYGGLIYSCLNDSVSTTAPDVDPANWEVNVWASWSEGYLQVPEATNENWKGEWDAATQYYSGDIVGYEGIVYEAIGTNPPPVIGHWPPSSDPFSLTTQYHEGDRVRYSNRIWEFLSEAYSVVGEFPTPSTWMLDENWAIWDRTYEELGIRESVLRDEAIYPTLKGMEYGGFAADDILAVSPVTSAEQVHFKVWIRDIGFDINDYLTSETPTFSITRGAMAGNDFEIVKVEPSTLAFSVGTSAYVLTLVRNSEDVFVVPDLDNSVYQTVETISSVDYLVPIGSASEDYAKFLLTGISMPNLYVRAAEERLLTSAQEYLAKYSHQQVTYAVGVDEGYAARDSAFLQYLVEGDFIGVIDSDMGIHGTTTADPQYIILQSLTITVGDGMIPKYDVVLSDEPVAGTLDAIKSDIKEQGRLVELAGRRSSDDIRKEALTNLFLKAALAGDTEIDRGLLMTNLLLLRNLSGVVNGGISGIQSDSTGIWTGGTYDDAINSLSKVLLRKDGSGHLAAGNLLWDTDGNLTTLGKIIATSGRFGLLDIIGESIIGDHIKITNDPIDLKASAIAAKTYTIPYKAVDANIYPSSEIYQFDTDESIFESDTTITAYLRNDAAHGLPFIFSDNTPIVCLLDYKIQVINNGVVVHEAHNQYQIGSAYTRSYSDGANAVAIPISKGTVKVRGILTMSSPFGYSDWDAGDYLIVNPIIGLSAVGGSNNITFTAMIYRSMIGADGLFSFTASNRHLYWRGAGDANDIMEIRIGNIILSQNATTISMSGLPTSATGLPSGSLWRNGSAINIVP